MHDDGPKPHAVVSYAGIDPPDARVSRLAIAAIPAGILCCPCLLSGLVKPIMDHLPRVLVNAGAFSWLRSWGVLTLMLGMTTLTLAAVVRVWTSSGRRSGLAPAIAGLLLSLLWWLLLLFVRFNYAVAM